MTPEEGGNLQGEQWLLFLFFLIIGDRRLITACDSQKRGLPLPRQQPPWQPSASGEAAASPMSRHPGQYGCPF